MCRVRRTCAFSSRSMNREFSARSLAGKTRAPREMDDTLRREVRFLTTRLGAIVQEQCGPKIFAAIETLRHLSKQTRQNAAPTLLKANEYAVNRLTLIQASDVVHAFSLFFHLVN